MGLEDRGSWPSPQQETQGKPPARWPSAQPICSLDTWRPSWLPTGLQTQQGEVQDGPWVLCGQGVLGSITCSCPS